MPQALLRTPSPGMIQKRTFSLSTRELQEDKRLIQVSFSSEQPYPRWFGTEILEHDPDSIDFTRLNNVGVSLFNHNPNIVIGIPEESYLDAKSRRTYTGIVFDDDEDGEKIYQKVKKGILRGVSVGYSVEVWEEVKEGAVSTNGRFKGPCWIAKRWTPLEVSIVSVPADDSVGVGRSLEDEMIERHLAERLAKYFNIPVVQDNHERKNNMNLELLCKSLGLDYNALLSRGMTDDQIKELVSDLQKRSNVSPVSPTPPADSAADTKKAVEEEKQRALEINALCRDYGIEEEKKEEFLKNSSIDQVKSYILEKAKDSMKPIGAAPSANVRIQEAEEDKIREAASDGLLMRGGVRLAKPAEGANSYRGIRLRDLAIDVLEREGVSGAHKLDNDELYKRALTPDGALSSIFTNTINKSMSVAYKAAAPTFMAWVGVGSNSDFKTVTHYQISEAGDLEEMTQTGEFKNDEISDTGVSKRVKTFGKKFGFTRQALINDDLGVLVKVPQSYVRAALRKRNQLVYKTLADNTLKIYDGKALFCVEHKNYDGTGAEISTTSIGEGRKAMRKQKNLRNKETLNIAPQFLIVPAALETKAAQFLKSVADPDGAHAGVANIYQNSMTPIVDAELDIYSEKSWYLAANPGDIDTIEVTYLNGNEMPTLESRDGFDFLGIEWRIFDDFGVTALDHRGLYCNKGA